MRINYLDLSHYKLPLLLLSNPNSISFLLALITWIQCKLENIFVSILSMNRRLFVLGAQLYNPLEEVKCGPAPRTCMWKFCWKLERATSFACLIDTKHFTDKCEVKWTKTLVQTPREARCQSSFSIRQLFKRDSLIGRTVVFFMVIGLKFLSVALLDPRLLVQTSCFDGYNDVSYMKEI